MSGTVRLLLALVASAVAAPLGAQTPAAQPAAPARPFLFPLFTDHAVLQRGVPNTIWGWAPARTGVVISFDGATQKTRADKNGRWKVTLPAHEAGGPYTLYATGSNGTDLSIADVRVGDVWLCSGQSNMEFPLRHVTNAEAALAGAKDESIRLFTVPRASPDMPAETLSAPASWQLTTPESAAGFSAACFFMGREIARTQKVTVGLIHSSWGGSKIEAWMPPDTLKDMGGYDEALGALRLHAKSPARAEEAFRLQMDTWWTDKAGDKEPGAFDYDDSAWPVTDGKDIWESWGVEALQHFDGIMWYRATLDLSEEQARSPAVLTMGAVDDLDETLVNGERVGGMRGWSAERSYRIRAGLLKPGRNVIAVRVLDTGGGGGLYGDPAARTLTFADGSQIPVQGPWKWQQGPALAQIGDAPSTPWGDAASLTALYNGMIAPIERYGMRGVAWYQGESNTGNVRGYAQLLPQLVKGWREHLDARPFLIVQLANYGPRSVAPVESGWAGVRDVQRRVAAADANAALASAVDIGDPGDIHPTQKLELGRRLGLAARMAAYGEAIAGSGPVPVAAVQDGGTVTIRFDVRSGGLRSYGSNRPLGFELCDAAGRCRFADATANGAYVTIAADGPVARVRYLWSDSPVANLYDGENLPVPGFELAVTQAAPAAAPPQPEGAPPAPTTAPAGPAGQPAGG
jgi:sialate O-acetylesterase